MTPELAEEILCRVEYHPGYSSRTLSRAVNVLQTTVFHVLQKEGMHHYRTQKEQA